MDRDEDSDQIDLVVLACDDDVIELNEDQFFATDQLIKLISAPLVKFVGLLIILI